MKTQTALAKPKFGESCNGCGYCCTIQPCQLANEFLNCVTGPCVALEMQNGHTNCGFVRNPLGYLFQAAHPEKSVPVLDDSLVEHAGTQLSNQIATALGIGLGCDAEDDEESEAWAVVFPVTHSSVE